MEHDFAAQKAETMATFADIQAEADLPDTADIDYGFVAGDGADWDAAETALIDAGFECARDADPADDQVRLRALLPDQPLTATAIWMGEDVATRIALAHGFRPDGWGFLA